MHKGILLSAGVFLAAVFSAPVYAGETEMLAMIQNLQDEMKEMRKTMQWQSEVIQSLRQTQVTPGTAIGPISDAAFEEQLKNKIGESDKWLKGLRFFGDFRLRYEGYSETSGGTSGGGSVANDRNRLRLRLRWGFEKAFNEEMKVGFRLASGEAGSITTRNQSFDSQFSLKNIGLDWAYATYTPNWAKIGPVKSFEVTAGKFKNPFEEGSSQIVWDLDLAPEGAYEKIQLNVFENEHADIDFSALFGQFVVEEGGGPGNSEDAELFAYQAGFKSAFEGILPSAIRVKNLVSFYDYSEITSPGNFSAANGNFTNAGGLSAESFDILGIYNEVSTDLGPVPTTMFFEWVKNTNESAGPSLGGGQDKGWSLALQIGKVKKKHDWQVAYKYIWIEANAVPGVFSESDYGHTDRRGSIFKFYYGLTDHMLAGGGIYFLNNITGGGLTPDEEQRLLQLEMIWKI